MAEVAQLIIDGDCELCRRVGSRLTSDRRFVHCRVRSSQELGDVDASVWGLSRELTERSVALVDANGIVHYGADAIVALLESASPHHPSWTRLVGSRHSRGVLDAVYRVVARHRRSISRTLTFFARPHGSHRIPPPDTSVAPAATSHSPDRRP